MTKFYAGFLFTKVLVYINDIIIEVKGEHFNMKYLKIWVSNFQTSENGTNCKRRKRIIEIFLLINPAPKFVRSRIKQHQATCRLLTGPFDLSAKL